MKLFRLNGPWPLLRALLGWPALIIGVYFFAALLGSLIPANGGWQEPEDGIEIFVETNGVHVGLIVPMQAAGEDLSDYIMPHHLEDPQLYGTHAMVGWGHEGVYRNAQTWADVRSGDIVRAAVGSRETVLHVYHRINPRPNGFRKAFTVSANQYRHIVGDMKAAFRLDETGRPISYPAYAKDNVFYAAKGHYSAFNTCNEWVAGILRRAGVRVGIWTPMPGGVMRWFPSP